MPLFVSGVSVSGGTFELLPDQEAHRPMSEPGVDRAEGLPNKSMEEWSGLGPGEWPRVEFVIAPLMMGGKGC